MYPTNNVRARGRTNKLYLAYMARVGHVTGMRKKARIGTKDGAGREFDWQPGMDKAVSLVEIM